MRELGSEASIAAISVAALSSLLGCGAMQTGGAGGVGSASVTADASAVAVTSSGGVTASHASSVSVSATSTASGALPPSASDLLALTAQCNQLSNGLYKKHAGQSAAADIPICGLTGAVFWKADMDIDCDGKMSAQCSTATDPYYQDQTSATDSNGDPLDSATLPYVVIPGKSSRFDYAANGLAFGSVVAVVYQNKVVYAVFGDIGPTTSIGEGSVALATALGIDPDPSNGGVESGVTYIAFTGANAVNAPIEDGAHAATLGQSLAASLVASNSP